MLLAKLTCVKVLPRQFNWTLPLLLRALHIGRNREDAVGSHNKRLTFVHFLVERVCSE